MPLIMIYMHYIVLLLYKSDICNLYTQNYYFYLHHCVNITQEASTKIDFKQWYDVRLQI